MSSSSSSSLGEDNNNCHRSFLARGVSLLEWPEGSHWTSSSLPSSCPLASPIAEGQSLLEAKDLGASYYRRYFYGQEHENWFGQDETLGPLAISVKKEKGGTDEEDKPKKNLYRIIIRATELNTIRGSILEESVPGVKTNSTKMHAKELLEFLLPEVQLSCLRLGLGTADEQVLKLDEQGLTKRHKVGVLYCRAGQGSEEEMYNNEVAGPAFTEFLDLIGNRVRLKGFDKYTGGLDNKGNE
jgi:signal-induced proliferation-associated 1 like protein 1